MYDLVVIGAGPGGYVAAIRAAQLGLKVACVEKEAALGGTCLRIGCIPSKALLESSELYHEARTSFSRHGIKLSGVELDLPSMMKRKDTVVTALTKGVDLLLKKNKVERVLGHGTITSPTQVTVGDRVLETKNILIATGSVSSTLPGLEIDGEFVGTSTEALSYPSVPEHLVVIGAGVIGLELGSVWARLGSQVTVLEYLDRILPGLDLETAKLAQKSLERQGLKFRLGARVTGARRDGDKAIVEVVGSDPVRADRVLVAVGRKPNTEGLGLENVKIATERGRIPVSGHLQTSVANIFAIGDVIRGPMLAHKAEDEGVAVAEFLVTGYGHVNYDAIPGIVYTHPEVASVGKTEEELQGTNYRKGVFPFAGNGRARALNSIEGQVKVLADAQTDRVLGVHIIGPRAGDLIAECVTAIEFSGSSEDIARICHAHPTLSEAVKEAALAVDGRAIHI